MIDRSARCLRQSIRQSAETVMSKAKELRNLIRRDGMTIAPGAYDCITATLIAHAGFPAVYMTGAGTAASYGYPDYGLLTMSEMVGNASRIAATVDLPVIAYADTGYGNELNVVRTVREFERHGIAAIHIEDQVFPKKCGHLDDKETARRLHRQDPRGRTAAQSISSSSPAPMRARSPVWMKHQAR
jgi:2-methylisocitrate lyase-like PEP mutase family enzyme